MTRSLIIAVLCGLMSGVALAQAGNSVEARSSQLNAALQDDWEYQLSSRPEFASEVGDTRYNDRLSDYSPEAVEKELRHARESLRRLQAIDPAGFAEQDKLNRELAVRSLRQAIEGAQFKEWQMPVDHFEGIHLEYASQLPKVVPFSSVKDYEDYLARLHQIPRAWEQEIAAMRLGMREGRTPPRYLLEKAAAQAQDIADKAPDASPFSEPVRTFGNEIPAAEQKRLRDAVLAAVKNEVSPAYAGLAKFLKTEYAPKGRTEYGVWALPDGDAYYRFKIRQMTTTELSPDQIHQMGLKHVAEIESEMLALAKKQGFSDLKSFNQHIREDRKLYATSGKQLLDLYQHYTDQMYGKLPQLFGHLPKNKLEVIPMDEFRAGESVPADYSTGSSRNGRPGRINVNETNPQKRLLLNVEAIAYHEGVPGHHMQFSVADELPDLQPFRRYADYMAYSEGWGLYSERLAKEVGFYQDPYSEYGRLGNEMWRAVRLVVDTGVHWKHWSREQMVEFFRQHTAMDEPNIQTEVDRYIVMPGQALAYKIGQMKIIELRERARQKLGPKFDVRAYHDEVLAQGPLPLDVLESRMDAWIAEKAASKGQEASGRQ